MVSYQKWTQIVFEVAKAKGMESSQENAQEGVSLAAQKWRANKEMLSAATVTEAKKVAEREVTVR